jgi:hypothetical protein
VKAPFDRIGDARSLAQIIFNIVRERLLVIDANATVLFAIGSFHRWFHFDPETTRPRRVLRSPSRKADWVQAWSTRWRINLMRA